jgi:2-polyprenyl-3-methyl-5-hydroxy-6-metoxy-1,4-benzoquinol methylase
VSWYAPHLERSLELIGRATRDRNAAIIDVGGGESTLVDDLLADGYEHITVLDISATAIEVAKERLGPQASKVEWLTGDVTRIQLPAQNYDVWHDRAVFHFLTDPSERARYVALVQRSVKPGGHVIVATFGPQGPVKCSGLDVHRYDSESLHSEFSPHFRLVESFLDVHHTPAGSEQQFLYCYCIRKPE